MEYNKVRISICGKEFGLQTEESATYMRELAKIMDSKIKDFMEKNSGVDLPLRCFLL